MTDTFTSAYNHPTLNKILDSLVTNQFYRNIKLSKTAEIDEQELFKATWLATILSLSDDDQHRSKALSLAVLAYLERNNDSRFSKLCYVIISRVGVIPLSEHMDEFEKTKRGSVIESGFNSILSMELDFENNISKLDVGDGLKYLSRYELAIWDLLNKEQYSSISGPTSSGKSFVVQNLLVKNFREELEYKCIYIVPTRALISEVTSEMKGRLKECDVRIRNALSSDTDNKFGKKELLILTPERCLKVFEKVNKEFIPNLVFFDEIQKLEDGERGVLFEYILDNLASSWKNTKFIIAGPYLDKLKKTFKELSGFNAVEIKSLFASVFQIVATLQYHKNDKKITAIIKSPSGKYISIDLLSDKKLYHKIKADKGTVVSHIINEYFQDDYNLIYSSRKVNAEKWAIEIAESGSTNSAGTEGDTAELIQYLSEEVHPNYALIRCLKNATAFHHGSMPEIARMEVENLYRSGVIKNIVCTTTLLEGVNLPAENIIVITDKKGITEILAPFEFGNLIGRAGRLSSHIYGSVYCIETDDDQWALKKLKENPSKEIVPVTTKTLTELKADLIQNVKKPPNDIKNSAIKYTLCLLRNKFLKNRSKVIEYLKNKELSNSEIDQIINGFEETILNLTVPKEILELNPTIDPLLQEQLYNKITEEGIQEWTISGNPYTQSHDIDKDRELPFNERSFYGKFENVAERLNRIFDICKSEQFIRYEEGHSFDDRPSMRQVVRYAVPWLRGMPYRNLIEMDINNKDLPKEKIDTIIREVIYTLDQYVRFELVKYFKIWSDILSYKLKKENKEEGKYLSLPQMLEFGAVKPRALELMYEGINRSVAIKIAEAIPSNYEGKAVEWIEKNPKLKLNPLFLKHLRNQGFKI